MREVTPQLSWECAKLRSMCQVSMPSLGFCHRRCRSCGVQELLKRRNRWLLTAHLTKLGKERDARSNTVEQKPWLALDQVH